MLKTNSKKVTERIYNDFIDELMEQTETLFTSSALYTLRDWIENATRGQHNKTYQDDFNYFVACGGFGYIYTDDQRKYLQEVLEETDEEANRYDDEKVRNTYALLFYRAYRTACEKYGVNPYWDMV